MTQRRISMLLPICLATWLLALNGCATSPDHDPTPQQNANRYMQQQQQMHAMKRAGH